MGVTGIKISVIVPAYNSEKYIKRCLNSIGNPKNCEVEVIVVNDGSFDKTAQIIREKFPKAIVITTKNCGPASARNTGLSAATGDYLMFLDADDAFSPDLIEKAANCIEKCHCDIISFPLRYIYDNSEEIVEPYLFDNNTKFEKKDFKKNIYFKMMTGIKFNSLCRNVYKKSLFTGVSFDTKMKTAEDLLVNMEIFTRAESMLYTTELEYFYYIRGNSITGSALTGKEKMRCNKIIAKKMATFLQAWHMNKLLYRIIIKFRIYIITILKIPMMIKQKLKNK